MFYKKAILKSFAISTGKHPCWSLLLNKVADLKPGIKKKTLVKKRLQHRCFCVHIVKFLKTPILKNGGFWDFVRRIISKDYEPFKVSIFKSLIWHTPDLAVLKVIRIYLPVMFLLFRFIAEQIRQIYETCTNASER